MGSGLQNKEERVDVVPSFPACSKAGENCISTGCCQVSGHKCFSKGNGQAQCNKTCTAGVKGFTCDIIAPHSVPVATPLRQNLYCFSVYTENTGNESLVSHELELLNIVAARGAGLFACGQWDVFSDVSAPLVNGYVTIKVEDTFGEFHQLKRKDSGTWVNWAMFYQVWVKIREVGKWRMADYTVPTSSTASSAIWRLSARRQSKCSQVTWRIATACSRPARTTAATGSTARGARTSSPRGAWITTTSTRSRPSMWPPTARVKQTGPRE